MVGSCNMNNLRSAQHINSLISSNTKYYENVYFVSINLEKVRESACKLDSIFIDKTIEKFLSKNSKIS